MVCCQSCCWDHCPSCFAIAGNTVHSSPSIGGWWRIIIPITPWLVGTLPELGLQLIRLLHSRFGRLAISGFPSRPAHQPSPFGLVEDRALEDVWPVHHTVNVCSHCWLCEHSLFQAATLSGCEGPVTPPSPNKTNLWRVLCHLTRHHLRDKLSPGCSKTSRNKTRAFCRLELRKAFCRLAMAALLLLLVGLC